MAQVMTAPRRRAERDQLDAVGRYLQDLGATPLLTASEEVALAKRIEAGVYAAELLRRGDHGRYSRADLVAVARDGRIAKDHMIRANLRLVVAAARKYQHRGLPFLDIVQEGNLGLIHAVEKFDYVKGFKFSTYAMWWIRQAIERAIAETTRVIRLPVHVVEEINRLSRVERQLDVQLGREPTVEELAAEAGVSESRVVELRRAAREAASLDTPVGEDGDTTVLDLVGDDGVADAVDIVENDALAAEIRAVVRSLPEREARIITWRYGLEDGRPRTLQEVAERIGLTRERVRQLEKAALAQLRTPERCQPLLEWAS